MPDISAENETQSSLVSEASPDVTAEQIENVGRVQRPVAQTAPQSSISEPLKYFLSFCILAIGGLMMWGLYGLKTPPAEQDSKELIPMVSTIEAMPYSGQLDKIISGTVVPFREIRVAAEINGMVVKKFKDFEAGNFVKKGTKLLEIDPKDYSLQLETGNAEVVQSEKMLQETTEEIAGAKRNIDAAEQEFKLANSDHQRNLKIRNALSSSELDQSKRALLAAETALIARKNTLDMLNAKYERMEASLALSQAKLNRLKLTMEKTVVVAPDDGVIVSENVQESDFVRTGDQLLMFEDTSRSEVICNLTPTDLAWIRNNSPASKEFEEQNKAGAFSAYQLPKTNVSVYDPSEKNVIWDGVLERFDGIGRDRDTRTIPTRITIKQPVVDSRNGQRALVRGMFVKCKIEVQTSTDNASRTFLSFPSVALRPGNYVWTVVGNRLKRVDVKVVDYAEQFVDDKVQRIVVVSVEEDSVQAGDTIVTSPIPQPNNGIEVILESEAKKKAAQKAEEVKKAGEDDKK